MIRAYFYKTTNQIRTSPSKMRRTEFNLLTWCATDIINTGSRDVKLKPCCSVQWTEGKRSPKSSSEEMTHHMLSWRCEHFSKAKFHDQKVASLERVHRKSSDKKNWEEQSTCLSGDDWYWRHVTLRGRMERVKKQVAMDGLTLRRSGIGTSLG